MINTPYFIVGFLSGALLWLTIVLVTSCTHSLHVKRDLPTYDYKRQKEENRRDWGNRMKRNKKKRKIRHNHPKDLPNHPSHP